MASIIGKTLGNKYKIVGLIGRGGMGTVYEAQHTILNRRVAIKVLQKAYTSNKTSVQRFIREGQTASAIDHPNIVGVYDFCQDSDGTVYIVMELLKGMSLRAVIDSRGPLPIPQTVSIGLNVLSALEAIHARNIIHRDLKPENIYLSYVGGKEQVKLLDFGVAKFKDVTGSALKLTSTGSVPGTPYYLAPELAKGGKHVDERIDIWALGVVLYEMLTGQVPFDGDNYNEVLSKILMSEHTPLESLCSDVPHGLAQVVNKALSKQAQDRYFCVQAMYKALAEHQGSGGTLVKTTAILTGLGNHGIDDRKSERNTGGTSTHTSPPSPTTRDSEVLEMSASVPDQRRKTPIYIYILAAVVVIGGLIGIGQFSTSEEPTQTSSAPSLPEESKTNISKLTADTTVSPSPSKSTSPVQSATLKGEASAPVSNTSMTNERTVKITLAGLPDGAKVKVDGKSCSNPIELPKSDTPVTIAVQASGFMEKKETIVPGEDRTLSMVLKKVPEMKRKSRVGLKKRQTKQNSSWRANPFAE